MTGVCREVRGGKFAVKLVGGGRLVSEIDVKWEVALKDGGGGVLRWEVVTQVT